MSYTNLNEIDSSTFSFEVDSNSYLIEITTTGAKQDFDMFNYAGSSKGDKVTSWDVIAPNPNATNYTTVKHGRHLLLYSIDPDIINSDTNLVKAIIKFSSWYLFTKIDEVTRIMILHNESNIESVLSSLSWTKEGEQRNLVFTNNSYVDCYMYSLLEAEYVD